MLNISDSEDYKSQRVREENDFIKNLIDCINPRIFFDEETREKITIEKHDNFAEKLKRNKELKQNISGKKINPLTKHKRAKLDPEYHHTITKIQEQLDHNQPNQNINDFSDNAVKSLDKHDELKKKLKERLDKLRSIRKVPNNKFMEKIQQKHYLSKVNSKNKRKKEKQNSVKEYRTEMEKQDKNSPQKYQNFSNIRKTVFSRFDFPESGSKNKKSKLSGKDYKSLLNKVQKENEKINELLMNDPEKASSLKEKNLWIKVLHKADGIKLKDDPVLLKRSLQKKAQIKAQKKKKRSEREKSVKEKMKARQKKRRDNILAKKKEKVKKKIKRAIKKGRFIPGFN